MMEIGLVKHIFTVLFNEDDVIYFLLLEYLASGKEIQYIYALGDVIDDKLSELGESDRTLILGLLLRLSGLEGGNIEMCSLLNIGKYVEKLLIWKNIPFHTYQNAQGHREFKTYGEVLNKFRETKQTETGSNT